MKVKLEPINNSRVLVKVNGETIANARAIDILNPVQFRFFKKGMAEFNLNFKLIVGKV